MGDAGECNIPESKGENYKRGKHERECCSLRHGLSQGLRRDHGVVPSRSYSDSRFTGSLIQKTNKGLRGVGDENDRNTRVYVHGRSS